MGWIPLLSTLAGATIALVSALLIERRRDRRERVIEQDRHRRQVEVEWRTSRQDLYSSYLAVLTEARNEMRRIARDSDASPKEKDQAARAACLPCYGIRYRMEILAPPRVRVQAIELFKTVRNLRDDFDRGAFAVSSEDSQLTNEYYQALRALLVVMREDLGVPSFSNL